MLRASITFFILGIIAIAFGANNIGGVSLEVGRLLLTAFLVLAGLSFILALFYGGKRKKLL